ncbi:MAG TPA: metallopeptidase TldD-related protein [Bryobacteraceae bacterium]|nr:metallopeptidase TldD-related protein [Bryobacteraceae bacterium]
MKPAPLLLALALAAAAQAQGTDGLLRAMHAEMARSMGLRMVNLEAPYFISYAVDDGEGFSVSAMLGGLVSTRDDRFRLPDVDVRVGSYRFDNTNYVGSDLAFGSRYALGRFPLEDVDGVLRRYLWLETDRAYKSALEAISRKRAALKNVAVSEQIDDFAKAEPVRLLEPDRPLALDRDAWIGRVRALSQVLARYPEIKTSGAEFRAAQSVHYLVTSEGTEVRYPEAMAYVRVQAAAQAPDGMTLRDGVVFEARAFDGLPGEAEMGRAVSEMAAQLTARTKAPQGDTYSGPVLFEGEAAAQLFAEVLGRNLAPKRRPVMEPGRPGAFGYSELEGRQGARILPEWMDVTDDATRQEWHGRRLFGSYEVDLEGVAPKPLSLVEKGVLKGFLLTRQPVRGFSGSNGRARLPGSFGANAAAISNLFVKAEESVPPEELKKKLLEMCQARGRPYGVIVRKMDFPSSASFEEVRRLLSSSAQSGGSHPVSLPLRVYRVYPDGREEAVRGLRFRGLNARSFKDIVAAGNDENVFDFLENGAPFALIGAGAYVAETSVVAPSVLIDDLELAPLDEELPKLPVVPAPEIGTGGGTAAP